ncbi:hypothetical protein [Maricaulis sp. CAU 1757]
MSSKQLLGGTAVALLMSSAAFAGDVEWFPPDPPNSAMSGECYARVRIEPEYDVYTESVTTQDAYERYDVLPPRLRGETRQYVSRDAGFRYVVTEPVYETITETVQVSPAYVEYVVQPAVHDTVTETILVREPRMVWRRGHVPGAAQTRYDAETGEIWCLVEEAGEYETVHRNIVVQPAEIREIQHAAEYAEITRDVLVREATVQTIPIEEQVASYHIEVMDQHASVNNHFIPAETTTVNRYSLRTEERWEWRLVDCNDLVSEAPQHGAPTRSYSSAPAPTGNTYLYGNDAPQTDDRYSEEVPVARASYVPTTRGRAY